MRDSKIPAEKAAAESSWNSRRRISPFLRDAAGTPFLQPAFIARRSHEERGAHILARLLRPVLHCLRAGFHKVGRLLMKPREAPRTSCSRGYSYDCYKQRPSVINVRKRGYLLPPRSALPLFLSAGFFLSLSISWHLD